MEGPAGESRTESSDQTYSNACSPNLSSLRNDLWSREGLRQLPAPTMQEMSPFPSAKEKEKGERELVSKTKIGEIHSRQRGALPLAPHFKYTGNPAVPLTMSSRSGGQDLVRKDVVQRVRRTCHVCKTDFVKGSKECLSCKHIRCKKCPREPPKLDKYPDGYPGDVDPPKLIPDRTFKKPRRRVHYICHVCDTQYNDGADICSQCGQTKCEATIRIPYVFLFFPFH